MTSSIRPNLALTVLAGIMLAAQAAAVQAQTCPVMRKINVGVSVAPPNVVHTSPYVAKELGFFARRCIDATIVQFEGGQSATANAAAVQGSAIVSVSDVAVGRGLKVQQFWGLAPRMPQAYMVAPDIKTAADLKGRRLSATGGGLGHFIWSSYLGGAYDQIIVGMISIGIAGYLCSAAVRRLGTLATPWLMQR